MTISEITYKIEKEQGALLVKPKPAEKGQPIQYEVKGIDGLPTEMDEVVGKEMPEFKGFTLVDMLTARAMNLVYNSFKSDESRAKWDTLSLIRLVGFTWEHVS